MGRTHGAAKHTTTYHVAIRNVSIWDVAIWDVVGAARRWTLQQTLQLTNQGKIVMELCTLVSSIAHSLGDLQHI
jgi:hypothetical protein